jgi:hypothetical protein
MNQLLAVAIPVGLIIWLICFILDTSSKHKARRETQWTDEPVWKPTMAEAIAEFRATYKTTDQEIEVMILLMEKNPNPAAINVLGVVSYLASIHGKAQGILASNALADALRNSKTKPVDGHGANRAKLSP